jgi:hypothetical protein
MSSRIIHPFCNVGRIAIMRQLSDHRFHDIFLSILYSSTNLAFSKVQQSTEVHPLRIKAEAEADKDEQ